MVVVGVEVIGRVDRCMVLVRLFSLWVGGRWCFFGCVGGWICQFLCGNCNIFVAVICNVCSENFIYFCHRGGDQAVKSNHYGDQV
jgi:hypothetical protein